MDDQALQSAFALEFGRQERKSTSAPDVMPLFEAATTIVLKPSEFVGRPSDALHRLEELIEQVEDYVGRKQSQFWGIGMGCHRDRPKDDKAWPPEKSALAWASEHPVLFRALGGVANQQNTVLSDDKEWGWDWAFRPLSTQRSAAPISELCFLMQALLAKLKREKATVSDVLDEWLPLVLIDMILRYLCG